MMLDRSLLAVGVLALLLVFAGCSGADSAGTATPPGQSTAPVGDPGDGSKAATVTPIDPSALDNSYERRLFERASDAGVRVINVTTLDGAVHVKYVSTDQLGADSSVLAMEYAQLMDDIWHNGSASWNATRLEAVAFDERDNPVARFRMPAYWGIEFLEYGNTRERLTNRLDATLEPATTAGHFGLPSQNLTSFAGSLKRVPNMSVAGIAQRNRSVFLTIRANASFLPKLERSILGIASFYGAFLNHSWDASSLEITVYDRSGDLYGWYRIPDDLATAYVSGNETAREEIRSSVFVEFDRLVDESA